MDGHQQLTYWRALWSRFTADLQEHVSRAALRMNSPHPVWAPPDWGWLPLEEAVPGAVRWEGAISVTRHGWGHHPVWEIQAAVASTTRDEVRVQVWMGIFIDGGATKTGIGPTTNPTHGSWFMDMTGPADAAGDLLESLLRKSSTQVDSFLDSLLEGLDRGDA